MALLARFHRRDHVNGLVYRSVLHLALHCPASYSTANTAPEQLPDVFLYTFLVPILPYVLENRLAIDPALTQRLSFALLAESSVIALVSSPFIGNYADSLPSKKAVLLASLAVALAGSIVLAAATSGMSMRPCGIGCSK